MRPNRFCAAIVVALMMTGVSFAEPLRMGLGISVDDDHGTIFFPVEKGNYIVEPMFYAAWDDMDMDGMQTITRPLSSESSTIDQSYDQKMYRAGIGFFRAIDLKEKIRMLAGMRVGYQYQKTESEESTVAQSGEKNAYSNKNDLDGAFFEPIISMEYAMTGNISLGGSISVVYARLTGDITRSYISTSASGDVQVRQEDLDVTNSTSSTETAVYLKYYF